MKHFFLIALASAILSSGAIASTLYSTSNNGAISGNAYGQAGYVDDYTGSSTISGDYLGSSTGNAYFSIQLTLPDEPQDLLSSALLSLTGAITSTFSDDFVSSEGSQGEYISGEYGCGLFDEDTCYDYSSNYSSADVYGSGSYGAITVDQIVSSSNTWDGSLTAGNSVDLLTLGFGSDLTAGGTLTLSGYVPVEGYLTGIEYSGFNAYTNFIADYIVGGNAAASLTLDGSVTPEPQSACLLFGGLFILFGLSLSKRSRLLRRSL